MVIDRGEMLDDEWVKADVEVEGMMRAIKRAASTIMWLKTEWHTPGSSKPVSVRQVCAKRRALVKVAMPGVMIGWLWWFVRGWQVIPKRAHHHPTLISRLFGSARSSSVFVVSQRHHRSRIYRWKNKQEDG